MTEKAVYLTDDRDLPDDKQRTLVIFPGGNGDWCVQVALAAGVAEMTSRPTRFSDEPIAMRLADRLLQQQKRQGRIVFKSGRWSAVS